MKPGVADFGYDFYLLAIASLAVGIAKLLHGQYFRLLDFYFHTLIQQRRNFKLCVGNENLHIVKATLHNSYINYVSHQGVKTKTLRPFV